MAYSHSPPVQLSALPFQFELKAWHLKDVEEAVAHHIGDGIIHTHEALTKPEMSLSLLHMHLSAFSDNFKM